MSSMPRACMLPTQDGRVYGETRYDDCQLKWKWITSLKDSECRVLHAKVFFQSRPCYESKALHRIFYMSPDLTVYPLPLYYLFCPTVSLSKRPRLVHIDAMNQLSVLLPACANNTVGSVCQNQGKRACGHCKLVVYCGNECQKAHWPEHKKDCNECIFFGGDQYLWGNTPAVDVTDLPSYLNGSEFSRIEVTNICDSGYVDIRQTLSLLTPFLQSPAQNPHATFITLFINAIRETVQYVRSDEDERPDIEFLSQYLPLPRWSPPDWLPHDADWIRMYDGRDIARDLESILTKYKDHFEIGKIAADLGVEAKKCNTIVEKWPAQMKSMPGDASAEEEFRLILGSTFAQVECYV